MKTELSFATIKLMIVSLSEIFVVPARQLNQILFHGLLLSVIIMGFWLLDSLKDPIIIANFIGMEYQPMAKLFSVLTTLILVSIYDFSTSILSKPTLFYLVSLSFGVIFLIFSALVSDPVVGLPNRQKRSDRYIAWFFYFSVEAYGSLMVAMFWSFTNTVMDLEQAKNAYGLIIATAQIGAIIGATLATHANTIGISQLILLSSMFVLSVSLLFKLYNVLFKNVIGQSIINDIIPITNYSITSVITTNSAHTNTNINENNNNNPNKITPLNSIYGFIAGFYEGLVIIMSHGYTIRLLALSCIYEIVVTILDYEFKLRGNQLLLSQLNNQLNLEFSGGLNVNNGIVNDDLPSSIVSMQQNMQINTGNNVGNNIGYNRDQQDMTDILEYASNHDKIFATEEVQFANLMGHFGQLTNG
jgi:AAA family ATP:ADP antiporter